MKSLIGSQFLLIALAAGVMASEAGAQIRPKPTAVKLTPTRKDPGPSMGLENFLQLVGQKNGNFKSIQSSLEAARARRQRGDLELSPVLTANAQAVDDKKPTILGPIVLSGTKQTEASLGIAKKFSTGTQAAVTASISEATTSITSLQPAGTSSTTNAFGALGISLSQSLWKDFFGESTDLRREREVLIEQAESQGLDLQGRQVFVDAEAAFWDHLYLKEELRQREESLARAKRIESWVKNRASNGIGDRADVLNAQGLVAGRELQLLSSQDELKASEERIRDLLEMTQVEPMPNFEGHLEGVRSPGAMVDGKMVKAGEKDVGKSQVIRLDAYLSVLEAKTKAVVAREVAEGMKPDLVLSGAYKTNSIDTAMGGAANNITDTSTPTTVVGVKFTYLLDGAVKDASRNAAKMESLAAEQKRARKLLESQTSWDELQRRHGELSKKIEAAQRSSTIQMQKADAERDRLSKGRTITSNVILAEQDAAESQLTLARMRAEQRKLESQGRMFIQISEQLAGAQ